MKTLTPLFVTGLLLASLHAQQPGAPAERQPVIFENDLLRVIDIHVPAGTFEPEHSHARGVTIALSDYDNETKTLPQGRVGHGHAPFGRVSWAEPVTHEARNTGTTEQHVVRIELKNGAPPAGASLSAADPLDGLVVCRETEKLLFENDYVRAIEERLPSGAASPRHSHRRGLVISLSDYDVETRTWPAGTAARSHQKLGDVRWSDAVTHEETNVGTTPTYAVRVEIK